MAMRYTEEDGFTLVELMVVVLIIGILVAIAVPLFRATKDNAAKKACFANQRTIETAVEMWCGKHGQDASPLAGVVTGGHPLLGEYVMRPTPRCPSAPTPANPGSPTAAEGAYTINADGTLAPCTFDSHGHY